MLDDNDGHDSKRKYVESVDSSESVDDVRRSVKKQKASDGTNIDEDFAQVVDAASGQTHGVGGGITAQLLLNSDLSHGAFIRMHTTGMVPSDDTLRMKEEHSS